MRWAHAFLGGRGGRAATVSRPGDRLDALGAAVGDEVGRAVRAVPLVVAVGRAEVSPATGGLGAVVSPAEAGEILGPGLAGWSVLVVGDGVVEVAGPGVDLASREDAVAVAEVDEVAHPGGWVVGVDGVAAVHVQHGLDDDLVVADPGPDLGEGGGAELLDLTDGEGVGFEVAGVDAGVDLDLSACWRLRVGR